MYIHQINGCELPATQQQQHLSNGVVELVYMKSWTISQQI